MKFNITQNQLQNATKLGLFICVIAIIVKLFPGDNDFKYQFEVGKPWSYELITASFDFPIYKSEQQISKERAELLKDFTPYFQVDTTIYEAQINKLIGNLKKSNQSNKKLEKLLKSRFAEIYSKGVVSVEIYNELLEDKVTEISCILPSRMTNTANISDIYTPRTAYEAITKNAPDALKSFNLNLYIVENLKYDSTTTNLSRTDVLKNNSLTSGMIQTGERIIDRGEIVNQSSFLALKSLKVEFDKRKGTIQQSTVVVLGEIIMILGLISLFSLYIFLFRKRIFESFSDLLFLSLLILMTVAMTALSINFESLSYYMVPFALLPIITRVFYDPRTALFVHVITMLIISFMVDNSFQFILLQITAGMVAVSSLKDMTQRSQLAQTAFYIFLSYIIMYLALEMISEGDINRIHWNTILSFTISSGFLLFAYVLVYIFEKLFGLISAVTLVELTNINSDLMIQFAEKAPGTFQHSLQVSNLATEAAKKINANSLLVRTGALYHDIGKLLHPEYYIENQSVGKNILLDMDYEAASKLVIQHVADGIELAKKNHLPEQIINFIGTHHGRSKTKYFYISFINSHPDEKPNEEAFTYPGPLPNTKETAILMMADAVEARSRSLTTYTIEAINEIVETMIDGQIADGQFKDAPISFRDVETVKEVFKEKIKNMYHARIVYPELNQEQI